MSRRCALVALPLLLMVGGLTACTEATRIPPPEQLTATEPLFATDEEALEAATAAYEEYLAVSADASSRPSEDPKLVAPLVTEQYLSDFKRSLEQLAVGGLRTTGSTALVNSSLQQYFEDTGGATVVIYTCLDVTGATVVDAEGVDMTPADRALLVSLEVTLVSPSSSTNPLQVANSEAWSGGAICEP